MSDATTIASGPGTVPCKTHRTRNSVVGSALTVIVLYAVFGVLIPKVADYGAVGRTLATLDPVVFVSLIFATILTMATFWLINMVSLPGLKFWAAAETTQAAYSVANTVPAGGPISLGLTYEMLKPYGYGADGVALMMGVSGIWNVFGKFVLPVASVLILVVAGEATHQIVVAAVVGVIALAGALAILGAILWKESLARSVGRGIGRVTAFLLKPLHHLIQIDMGEKFVEFRTEVIDVVRRRWAVLTGLSVANQLAFYLALVVCLRGAGIPAHQLTWAEILAAFAFARLASAVPITPGAVGVAEGAYIGLLVAAGGPTNEVVAAVLLFRAATYLVPIPVGGVMYLIWVRSTRLLRHPQGEPYATTS